MAFDFLLNIAICLKGNNSIASFISLKDLE